MLPGIGFERGNHQVLLRSKRIQPDSWRRGIASGPAEVWSGLRLLNALASACQILLTRTHIFVRTYLPDASSGHTLGVMRSSMKHPFFIDAVLRSGSLPVTHQTASDADSLCRSGAEPLLKDGGRFLTAEANWHTLPFLRSHSIDGRGLLSPAARLNPGHASTEDRPAPLEHPCMASTTDRE
jgi:hypothetical protein